MNINVNNTESIQQKSLRLLPGIIIVILQWLIRYGLPTVFPDNAMLVAGVFGALLGGLAIMVWWAFFSRAPRFERWSGVALMIVALVLTSLLIHKSLETAMSGMMFPVYAIPVLSLAFVVWAFVSRNFTKNLRRITMAATILLSTGVWILIRTNGITGELDQDFAWRWSQTAEEKLLDSETIQQKVQLSITDTTITEAEWPGFRGPNRDGIIHGVQIGTDWATTPPTELWRRPIGPG